MDLLSLGRVWAFWCLGFFPQEGRPTPTPRGKEQGAMAAPPEQKQDDSSATPKEEERMQHNPNGGRGEQRHHPLGRREKTAAHQRRRRVGINFLALCAGSFLVLGLPLLLLRSWVWGWPFFLIWMFGLPSWSWSCLRRLQDGRKRNRGTAAPRTRREREGSTTQKGERKERTVAPSAKKGGGTRTYSKRMREEEEEAGGGEEG